MPDYRTVDKTEWFIQHMRSGWFSRREIVGIAAKEFPSKAVCPFQDARFRIGKVVLHLRLGLRLRLRLALALGPLACPLFQRALGFANLRQTCLPPRQFRR